MTAIKDSAELHLAFEREQTSQRNRNIAEAAHARAQMRVTRASGELHSCYTSTGSTDEEKQLARAVYDLCVEHERGCAERYEQAKTVWFAAQRAYADAN